MDFQDRQPPPHHNVFAWKGDHAMVIGIFVVGIFLGFSLGFATMALVAAKNDRLQFAKAQTTGGPLTREPYSIRRFNRAVPAKPQASGASCLLNPGS
jgi:hypothetical protein